MMSTNNTRILSGCFSVPTMDAYEVSFKNGLARNGMCGTIVIPQTGNHGKPRSLGFPSKTFGLCAESDGFRLEHWRRFTDIMHACQEHRQLLRQLFVSAKVPDNHVFSTLGTQVSQIFVAIAAESTIWT